MPRPSRLALRIGHACPVRALAHAPDRRLLATGDDLGNVLLHDTETGARRVLRAPESPPVRSWPAGARSCTRIGDGVAHLAFVRGGAELVVAGDDLTFFDVASGRELRTVSGLSGPLTPDGMEVWAWADDATIVRIDPRTGGRTREVGLDPAPAPWRNGESPLAIHVGTHRIAQVHAGRLRLWDLDAGGLVAEWPVEDTAPPEPGDPAETPPLPADYVPPPVPAFFSPDGARVAVGQRVGVVIVEVGTGASTEVHDAVLEHAKVLAWTTDGLVGATIHGTWRWDGARVEGLAPETYASAAPYAPLVLGGWDGALHRPNAGARIRALFGPSARRFASYDGWPVGPGGVRAVALRDATVRALTDDGLLRTWCLRTGTLLAAWRPAWGAPIALAVDGAHVVTAGHGSVYVWHADGSTLRRFDAEVLCGGRPLSAGRFSVGGGRLAVVPGRRGGRLLVWDLASGEALVDRAASRWACVALAGSGRLALGGAVQGGTVTVFEPDGREWTLDGDPEDEVAALALSPYGRYLVTANEGSRVTHWRLDAPVGGERLFAHRGSLRLACTDDGRVAAAPAYDARIFVFDPIARRCHARPGHRGDTRVVAFSADGRLLASGGEDGAVVVRDAVGRPIVTLQALPGGRWLTYTPDGAWRGEGTEPYVGDGYTPAPPPHPAGVERALRRLGATRAGT